MAIRNILQVGDDLLRKQSKPVTSFDRKLWQLLDDIAETLHKEEGAGLAAPQIGVLRRIVVIDVGDGILELMNPVVIREKGIQQEVEGCLSLPGKYALRKRPQVVEVKAMDRRGREFRITGKELLARALSHEIDHLNGVLFIDNIIRMVDSSEFNKK
ncbi:MAG: peptide deformylase [Clostridia bacterium]|nr:peptide deformylase [Clostridia bacterium]